MWNWDWHGRSPSQPIGQPRLSCRQGAHAQCRTPPWPGAPVGEAADLAQPPLNPNTYLLQVRVRMCDRQGTQGKAVNGQDRYSTSTTTTMRLPWTEDPQGTMCLGKDPLGPGLMW